MKFAKDEIAYIPVYSYDNGKKHIYEKVTIENTWVDEKWGNMYSFIHQNGDRCNSCPEECLLNQKEYEEVRY